MCSPTLAIGALGLGMQYASKRANDRAIETGMNERMRYNNAALNNTQEQQLNINQLVNDQIPTYSPEASQEQIATYSNNIQDSINNAVLTANLGIDDGHAKGKTSAAYERAYAGEVLDNQERALSLAQNYADIAAPNYLGFDQSVDRQQVGEQIQGIGMNVSNVNNISQNASNLVNVRPNSMAGLMGSVGQYLTGQSLGNMFSKAFNSSGFGTNGNMMPKSYGSQLYNKPVLNSSNYAFG